MLGTLGWGAGGMATKTGKDFPRSSWSSGELTRQQVFAATFVQCHEIRAWCLKSAKLNEFGRGSSELSGDVLWVCSIYTSTSIRASNCTETSGGYILYLYRPGRLFLKQSFAWVGCLSAWAPKFLFSRFGKGIMNNSINSPVIIWKELDPNSTLAWKIPWMEEPGRLQSMGSLRVGHNWATSLSLFTCMRWRRKWQPTPVFLPG